MKPILFNTEMVRAFLDNRKQVTRRVVKDADPGWDFVGLEKRPCELRVNTDGEEYPKELDWPCAVFSAGSGYCDYPMRKGPYRPGDILYVRETWAAWSRTYGVAPVLCYKADGNAPDGIKWRPSIHMPKAAARIWLMVTDVRVERLQDITPEQAVREGAIKRPQYSRWGGEKCLVIHGRYRQEFSKLWDSTIKKPYLALYGWNANPWVWVIEFERCEKPEGEKLCQKSI